MRRDPGVAFSKGLLARTRSNFHWEDYRDRARRAFGGTEAALLAELLLQKGPFLLHDEGEWRADLNASPTARACHFINDRYHQSAIPTR